MFKKLVVIFCLSIFFLTGCATLQGQKKCVYDKKTRRMHCYYVGSKNYHATGLASWYGRAFQRHRTSSGERYNMYGMTAAHRTLPLSTRLLVTNLSNGKKVIVRVNDRGPFVHNRLIDLSYGAAKQLHMIGRGTAPVELKAI